MLPVEPVLPVLPVLSVVLVLFVEPVVPVLLVEPVLLVVEPSTSPVLAVVAVFSVELVLLVVASLVVPVPLSLYSSRFSVDAVLPVVLSVLELSLQAANAMKKIAAAAKLLNLFFAFIFWFCLVIPATFRPRRTAGRKKKRSDDSLPTAVSYLSRWGLQKTYHQL